MGQGGRSRQRRHLPKFPNTQKPESLCEGSIILKTENPKAKTENCTLLLKQLLKYLYQAQRRKSLDSSRRSSFVCKHPTNQSTRDVTRFYNKMATNNRFGIDSKWSDHMCTFYGWMRALLVSIYF